MFIAWFYYILFKSFESRDSGWKDEELLRLSSYREEQTVL